MGEATAVAHPNIALVKYWGKRDHALNLPAAGSVSLTLGPVRTRTTVRWGEPGDRLVLDGETADATATRRVSAFLDLVRALVPDLGGAEVVSANDFPTAAGLASSSSGFAALAVAATEAAGLALDTEQLSVLARRGSGSAARSVLGGFVRMNAGIRDDGTDSFAVPVADVDHWDLRVVIAVTEAGPKDVASTVGMNRTQETSPYYAAWIDTVAPAMEAAEAAIRGRDFDALAVVAEASAMQMHASAIAAVPAVLYWRGATVDVLHRVRSLRSAGTPVFSTVDAGPHVKAFTTTSHVTEISEALAAVAGVTRVLVAKPAGPARVVACG